MSGAVVAATGGAAAAAAAAKAAKERKEEEQMTPYDSNDLDGWEFKIVRAQSARFKSPESVRRLCDEEAQSGWEMVEKFDNSRIRFKRRVGERSQDQYRDVDAYRTQVGASETQIVIIVLSVCLALGLGAFLAFGLR